MIHLIHWVIDLFFLSLVLLGFKSGWGNFICIPITDARLCNNYNVKTLKTPCSLTEGTDRNPSNPCQDPCGGFQCSCSHHEQLWRLLCINLGDSLCVPCAHSCGATVWMSGRTGHCVHLGVAVKTPLFVCVCVCSYDDRQDPIVT